MRLHALIAPLLALLGSPVLLGIIGRTKAVVAGRRGPPLFQPYRDLAKLLRKGAVYAEVTTAIFRAGPVVSLAALVVSAALVPLGGAPAPLAFEGDVILFAGLLAVARFATVLAALDTGSSFEGMGASREVTVAALAEPALLVGLAALARSSGSVSLTTMLGGITPEAWGRAAPAFAVLVAALLVVFLAENARMPVDDPATHLELTMIHEVMVLDHSGVDLAFILYGSSLKLWLLGALLIALVVPVRSGHPGLDAAAAAVGMLGLAVLTGLVESGMARLRLIHVPQLLVGASVLGVLAFVLMAG